jgi:hypothetical protein
MCCSVRPSISLFVQINWSATFSRVLIDGLFLFFCVISKNYWYMTGLDVWFIYLLFLYDWFGFDQDTPAATCGVEKI